MLQADKLVADPKNGQNYNRYSYVLNNPLKYTDPSGWVAQRAVPEGLPAMTGNFNPQTQSPMVEIDGILYEGAMALSALGLATDGMGRASNGYSMQDAKIHAVYGHDETGAIKGSYSGNLKEANLQIAQHNTLFYSDGTQTLTDGGYSKDNVPKFTKVYDYKNMSLNDGLTPSSSSTISKWHYEIVDGGGFFSDLVTNIGGGLGMFANMVSFSTKQTIVDIDADALKYGKKSASQLESIKTLNKVLKYAKHLGVLASIPSLLNDANNALRNPTQENVLRFVSSVALFTLKTHPLVGLGIGILDATGVSDNIIQGVSNGIDFVKSWW